MSDVAIVTDSTSDLSGPLAETSGITIVPLFVRFGDESFRDTVDLSREAFYRRFRESSALPSTSQPASAMFADAFRPHVEAGRSVVCLTIDGHLSGTVNAARAAANEFPDATIAIVDSGTVSGGLGGIALYAADLARTSTPLPSLLAALERARDVARGYAVVPDLSHAVRTGRVSRPLAMIGSMMNVLPVLRLGGGTIEQAARVRTFARAQDAMIAAALKLVDAAPNARVIVAHADAPGLAQTVAERVRTEAKQPLHTLEVVEAGPVIATHAGPGAVGVFVLPG